MSNYYHINDDFSLIQGDTMQELPQLTGQFDMIFADPPYFLSGGGRTIRGKRIVAVNKGNWDTVRTDEEKDEFNYKWLSLCRNLLKPNGTIWICGTFHNIYSVERCLNKLGYKLLNVSKWQMTDPPPSLTGTRFNFASEYIIWAAKSPQSKYFLDFKKMTEINGGKQMPDVWQIPSVGLWEKRCGKHPTQKTLRLLYRIILACTHEGDTILDPFAGSCTTGIAANLLNRKFIGIDQSEEYLQLGIKRKQEITDKAIAEKMLRKMSELNKEDFVLVNHADKQTRLLMIKKGICYLRAGDSKGSLQVTPGFERMKYVLLHTNGDDCQFFKLDKTGTFQIWSKETLEEHGFNPEHAKYYIVVRFNHMPEDFKYLPRIKQKLNTYRAKIIPLSEFMGLK